ncbi:MULTISPECIES: hypothetical protein [Streptomyces]|uniref:Uncharacterized protein n=1 Tax=Streptomyces stelliscabiei TaxID=146820 RepID=A0A8I0TTU6_9ACTN|nr:MULTISPECIES: hypothetical protein [Streptomyces]MDH6454228.1 hypothetical protein [Streptomyces sp. SAI-119]MDH6495212.1 hypothetical protein [Streptomyces sp. SAI-149]MBE1601520.1 hypothetical protein [Streptomyces stelliscabiei]MDX2515159.1 hypothetical protein [Streptomyces stelliscabiei]MDX2538780.1 hypothetical protein [Streptomyces scabiei]
MAGSDGHWDGSACVDATVIGTYAKGLAPDSPPATRMSPGT